MPWRTLTDPTNRQNPQAGNGGDFIKHTVYLTVLDHLLARPPWNDELRVRECHAGRGMYRIPNPDDRRGLLEHLYRPIAADVGVLLHDTQRASQTALGVWPNQLSAFEWYSGSVVVNAWRLGHAEKGKHLLELYEQLPTTRAVLRALSVAPGLQSPQVNVRILPDPETGQSLDGERHIATSVPNWNAQDLILLDPFAMWRQSQHQRQRDLYRRIIDGIIAHGAVSPSLILFWTWGRAYPIAEGDLSGTNPAVRNGYQELRTLLHRANRHFLRVTWRWGLQFAMWVLVPTDELDSLRDCLENRCNQLRDHLQQNGHQFVNPDVDVRVD